jgi:uncharacterized hydantoinase/oxoprolinase family protein
MSVPQEVTLARHAADLDDNGHEDILTSVTGETDDTLVLHPDGTGGVEWVAPGPPTMAAADVTIVDAGGYFTGTDVEAALQELAAADATAGAHLWAPVMASAPHILTTTGDAVYIPLVTTDGAAIMAKVPA